MRRLALALAFAFTPVLAGLPVAQGVPIDAAVTRPAQPLRLDLVKAGPVELGQRLDVELRLHNPSTQPVEDLQITARRGDRVDSAAQAQQELAAGNYPYFGPFAEAGSLAPGSSMTVKLEIPTELGPDRTLAISKPGVYPLMFTLTGTQSGQVAEFADERFLLPVDATSAASEASEAQAAPEALEPADPDVAEPAAHQLSVIYPLTARLDIVPGETGGLPLTLQSEQLAGQLQPGGRLDELLETYLDHDLGGAGCVALDPALVSTVHRMSQGYLVGRNRPSIVTKPQRLRDSWFKDDTVSSQPGTGVHAAARWMEKLRQVDCLVAMPWANTDVDAVARAQNDFLFHEATARGDIIENLVGTALAGPLLVPDAGTTDVPLESITPLEAGNFDPALAELLAAVSGEKPSFNNVELNYDLDLDSPAARELSAQAALKVELERADTVAKLPNYLEPAAAKPILDAAEQEMKTARAMGIETVINRGGKAKVRDALVPDPTDILKVQQQAHYTDELMRIMVNDPQIAMTRYDFTLPLRRDLLMSLSRTPRPKPGRAGGETGAKTAGVDAARLHQNSIVLQDLRNSVQLIPPGNVYTRVSSSSPLLIVAENPLPLPVKGHLLYESDGAKLQTPDSLWIPAKGSITVSMTADIPKRHDIRLWLANLDGATISQPVVITVQTTGGMLGVYGIIVALLVLAALTLRRKKGS